MNLVLRKMALIDKARKEREEEAKAQGYATSPYVTSIEQDIQKLFENINGK